MKPGSISRIVKATCLLVVGVSFALLPRCTAAETRALAELNVFNWNNSLSQDTIEQFQAECHCKVNLSYYGSMEEALAKLAGGARGFDVIGPSNYGIPALVRLGALQPLNKAAIPNAANIEPAYLDTPQDPHNVFSLPYDFTITLIGYNEARIRELGLDPTSWSLVFDPKVLSKIRGKVTVLDDPREVIAAALRYKGYSANSTSAAQLSEAIEAIRQAMPYWAAFNSQSYIRELTVGNIWVALGYSNDIFQAKTDALNAKRPFSIKEALQKEGNGMTGDSFVISRTAPHPELAHRFSNFMLQPKIAAQLTNTLGSGNPNRAAHAYIRAELLSDPAINPGPEERKRLEQLTDLDSQTRRAWNRAWTELKMGQ